MTKLEFLDKINDILVGLNTLESDLLGSLYDELMRDTGWRLGSERPLPATGKKIIVYYKGSDGAYHAHTSFLNNLYEWFGVPESVGDNLMWCYPPEEDKE